jgi:hypothetical protein
VDLVFELIPIVGVAGANLAKWWTRRRATTIVVSEDARDQLGDASEILLSPKLVRALEHGDGMELVAEVEDRAAPVPELTMAEIPDIATGQSRWTRDNVTFALLVFFSLGGFVWSLITLSTNASEANKYAATATISFIFGQWLRPDLLRIRGAKG